MLVKSIDLHEAGLLEKYIELKKNNHDIIFSERQKNRITVIIEKVRNHAKTITNIKN